MLAYLCEEIYLDRHACCRFINLLSQQMHSTGASVTFGRTRTSLWGLCVPGPAYTSVNSLLFQNPDAWMMVWTSAPHKHLENYILCRCLTSHNRKRIMKWFFSCLIWAGSGFDISQTNLGARSSAAMKAQRMCFCYQSPSQMASNCGTWDTWRHWAVPWIRDKGLKARKGKKETEGSGKK